MAQIVMITSEMAGRINISAELGHRLVAAGHRVTIASPVDIGDRLGGADLPFVHLISGRAGSMAGQGHARDTMPKPSGLGRISGVRRRRDRAVLAMNPDGIARSLADLEPDLVLVDVELPVHVMAACSIGVRVALWMSMMSVWKRPGLPPLHTAVTPGAGWPGTRLGIEAAWLKFRVGKWVGMSRRRIRQVGGDRISVLRAVAERTGFPLQREASMYDWLVPFTYRSLPVLSFNALELEFPHDPQPNCSYVGPVLAGGGAQTPEGVSTDERLADILARRIRGDPGSLVYCSFGAWRQGEDPGFLLRVVDAVATRPQWELVIGLGDQMAADRLGPLPPNVHVLAWAPQQEILRLADVAIHHGGISSINECIASHTPMVLYPFDFLDQPGNAARVAFHRLGEVGDRNRDTADDIATRIGRVMADGAMQSNLRRMADLFAEYVQQNRAVRAIENLL